MARNALICCVLMLNTWTVFAVDPTVTIAQTNPEFIGALVEGQRGDDITLDCHVENKPSGKALRWLRILGNHTTLPISTDLSVDDNIKYSIENPFPFTFRLRIRNAQVADEGFYVCFVQVAAYGQNKVKDEKTVLVKAAPYFLPGLTTPDMTVTEEDKVDLICNATGRPPPHIEWMRLGGALLPIGQEKHFEPLLHMEKIQAQDRGKYRCTASNVIGMKTQTITHTMTLDVKFTPKIEVQNDVVYQATGYQIELMCLCESNPFPNEEGLWWTKGNIRISTSDDRYDVRAIRGAFNRVQYELIIRSVRDDDYGEFRCSVKNGEGTTAASIRLEKTDEPQKSHKIGQIVGGVSPISVSLVTFLLCLLTLLLH